MKDGYRVFDSDMHVLEPADLWERYIDPAFRHRAPRGTTRTPMDVGVTVDGADDIARGFDARAQLTAMDREGIDVTVLYPSRGLFVHSISDLDPAFSEAIARAYNDWLADFCRDGDPRRMYGAAMLPIHDVAASIREARRAVRDLGFKAVFLRPNPPRRGIYWHHPGFDPLWAEVQDLDVPVGF